MTSAENTPDAVHIEIVADEALTTFDRIAQRADQLLKGSHGATADALVNVNTLTGGSAVNNLERINKANQDGYRQLKAEPAIARVVVADDKGEHQTYYVCRTSSVSGVQNLASYGSPVGRLAALDIGSEFIFPDDRSVVVVEQAKLKPFLDDAKWDARDTVFEGEDFGPITVKSLRALLAKLGDVSINEDLLERILAEAAEEENIVEGIRRNVITKMGLRDQPILDMYQDEIFRLPLDKRLLILGPPGTGKTTTLIRRLGQKLDSNYLDESEQRLTESVSASQGIAHASSWMMFTPTELLKQYLKEAFNREGVPAPEPQLKTWDTFRHDLARNVLGILSSGSGGGTYVLKSELPSLGAQALSDPISWFEDFNRWQYGAYLLELQAAAQVLGASPISEGRSAGDRLLAALTRQQGNLVALFEAIAVEVRTLQAVVNGLKDASDKRIRGALALQVNGNPTFLIELARFLDGLQQSPVTDDDDADDQDPDDEEDAAAVTTPVAKAQAAFYRAVKAQAKAAAGRRVPSKLSRNGRVIEWLEDRSLPEGERQDLGASLIVQTEARRFLNPVKRYLGGIAKRYRSYRREQQRSGRWYVEDSIDARHIHPLELDVVVLTVLRSAGEMTRRASILRNIDEPIWSALSPIVGLYRNQILVDEATDFSPLQLAAMAALTQPSIRSFFACGDFNQRLTTWGARSVDEMRWIFPDIDVREVSVAYRQSRQLNDLARAIVHSVGGTDQAVSLPLHVDSEGVAPVLLEGTPIGSVSSWLASRIREIERFVGQQLPSTAIFVNAESDVEPIAKALGEKLAEHNLRVVPCRDGQVVGQDNDIRVFDVQHIKGLEFEAVFFISIDELAELKPDLFDRYLYVGATRAATYLGLTCAKRLPRAIETLRPHFEVSWGAGIGVSE
ncbi:ATP-binding domain-containing protein [Lysobacter sp. KIS68-7]|uniref:ATP-binding domain-containing protein n=1 Tax=Lysobacter sp. KIS68-7 TaxID=2904252 RepID=UPI001E34AC0E|nr:ATP-binding domain-containing protein [Lysobacter sp. KIS68-7]UHQ19597.1 ATP-binding domain-containing protein [Lysobacter sp. KIS68-7]